MRCIARFIPPVSFHALLAFCASVSATSAIIMLLHSTFSS
jgi:hypothetical protein